MLFCVASNFDVHYFSLIHITSRPPKLSQFQKNTQKTINNPNMGNHWKLLEIIGNQMLMMNMTRVVGSSQAATDRKVMWVLLPYCLESEFTIFIYIVIPKWME